MNKLPGYSWVDIRNKTHVFGVEDWSHPQKKEIYEKLDSLLDQIKRIQTESVLIEMDDNLKEKLLHYHSERLTIMTPEKRVAKDVGLASGSKITEVLMFQLHVTKEKCKG
ncbi:hypothetical protein JHK85_001315 [Glycine max]|nr:hypothetical protein JHK85_001315 [Glycine max]KAG5088666.1 hypothetical protein JHK86_001278 [Glycine max]